METAKLPKTKKILFDNKPKPEIPTKQKEINTESKLKEVNTP